MNDMLICKNRGLSPVVPLFFYKTASKLLAILFVTAALLFSQNEAHAAIAVAQVTQAASTTTSTTQNTAAFTPVANTLYLMWVSQNIGTGPPTTPTATCANGLNFVQVNTVTLDTITTQTARVTLFRAMKPSGLVNGTCTISWGQSAIQYGHVIVAFTGADASGTDGAGAIGQSVTGRADSATTAGLSIALAALQAGSTTAGGFSNSVNSITSLAAGVGYTAGTGVATNGPNTSLRAEWNTTGSTTVNMTQSATSNIGGIAVEVRAPATVIADGTAPSSVTIAPSASITDLDYFTLATTSGADTVTGVTVTLGPAGAFNNIAQVDLTDNSNVARCTAVTNPASNTISFATCASGGGIPVTTTAMTYKVRITPKTHAAMPLPAVGLSYATTGTVTAFTSTNVRKTGTDSTSATVTVDNLSPSGATATSGSAGNAKTTLNWTTSSSGDFVTTSGSVVYRWAAASAGSEVPTEGSTPVLGSVNGTATVACLVSSAASTPLTRIDGTGGSADCTTAALINGQPYTYKVFQKDTSGNYDVGVTVGTVISINPTNSTVVASPTSVPADGTTTSMITVTLKDGAGNPVSGKTVTLTAGSGSSFISAASGPSDASGVVTFTVKDSVAESVTYTATDTTDGITITQTATVSFTTVAAVSTFDACEATTPCTAGGARLYTKLVGTGFNLDLVALNSGGSIVGSFTGPVSSIDLIAYTAANPANMTGAINRCPVNLPLAGDTINLGTSVAFTSGRKSVAVSAFSSAYRDVRVRITYSGTNYCSTDKFSVRPQALSIGVTDSGGGAFPTKLAAGADFKLTASGGTGYDGTPASLTSSAAAQTVRTHVGATDYTGRLLQSGANTIAFPAAVSGVSNAMVQYHDVGSFEALAQKVIDNSFTSVDVAGTDCVSGSASNTLSGLLYGCNIANTAASGLFGRFYPSYYTLASSTLAGACGSSPNDFTYMGQSGLSAGYTLSAWSQANPTSLKLTKYTAGYSNLATVSVVAADGATVTDLSSNLSPALTGAWSAGDYAVAVAARTYARPTAAATGPYDSLNIAVGITDSDGAALNALDFKSGVPSCTVSCTHKKLGSASTKVRFGRLRLSNAYGSELLDLPVPLVAQYWNGSAFVTNAADKCTTLTASNIKLTTTLTGVNATVGGAFSLGAGSLTLTKPTPAAKGVVALCVDLDSGATGDTTCQAAIPAAKLYLQTGAAYDKDPTAQATFGVYKGSNQFIYMRENY